MHRGFVFWTLAVCLQAAGLCAQDIDAELKQSSADHMREELGVNPITTPSIQDILKQLELFRPVPIDLIDSAKRDAVFNNRLQTAMHFGSLVADGFMLTLAERPKDIQDVGKALIPLDGEPLIVAGRLVQEDLVVLERPEGGDEHVLTGAILCFPSNWTLAEKFGKGLARIHLPIESYDASIARRVQRMFDLIRPEAPVMRANSAFS